MENLTSPASNNKAPYRGVASRPNSKIQWGGGGGGGGETTLNMETAGLPGRVDSPASQNKIFTTEISHAQFHYFVLCLFDNKCNNYNYRVFKSTRRPTQVTGYF